MGKRRMFEALKAAGENSHSQKFAQASNSKNSETSLLHALRGFSCWLVAWWDVCGTHDCPSLVRYPQICGKAHAHYAAMRTQIGNFQTTPGMQWKAQSDDGHLKPEALDRPAPESSATETCPCHPSCPPGTGLAQASYAYGLPVSGAYHRTRIAVA